MRKPTVDVERRNAIDRALATILSRIHPSLSTRRKDCLDNISKSVKRIKADPFALLDLRDNLKAAARALNKADKLIPPYGVFAMVHETIREASNFIEEQVKRLKVPRSGGPGKGATERKRRAAAEAYVLIRRWQKRDPEGKDTVFINLASQLYEAATGETEEEANCKGQCATFVKEMQRAKDQILNEQI